MQLQQTRHGKPQKVSEYAQAFVKANVQQGHEQVT